MENTTWEEISKNIVSNVYDSEIQDLYTEVETPFFGNEEIGWIHITNLCEHLMKENPILRDYEENLYDELIDFYIQNDWIDSSGYEDLPEITCDDGFTRLDLHQENVYENYIKDGHFHDDEEMEEHFKEILLNIEKWREKNKGKDTYP